MRTRIMEMMKMMIKRKKCDLIDLMIDERWLMVVDVVINGLYQIFMIDDGDADEDEDSDFD